MIETAKSIYAWLIGRPGYMLLTASRRRITDAAPERFTRAWMGVVVLSVGWGLALEGLWGGAWKMFGDGYYGIPVMPVAAVVVPTCLWVYRRGLLALGSAVGGDDTRSQSLVACAAVVLLTLCMLGLRRWNPDWPTYLHPALKWTSPMALFRVLILAPIWGGWAMLITSQFCKPDADTEPAVAAFARGCSPVAAAGVLAGLLAVTLLYFHFMGWWRLTVPGATIAAAVLGGIGLCKRSGGLRRNVLLGVNVLTQLVFILAYLANR